MVPKRGPEPTVGDAEFLRAAVADRKPVRSTSEIAESVGLSRQATNTHLERLAEAGKLHRGKAGPTTVWWPTPEGRELLAQSDSDSSQ
jgi:predicted ArsR family transcriptional regulator